ncbi:DMT family transporter [Sphingobium nicotianae]|uniref:EamA family transporter n=1 Tax=Sphingobium nicotianae TaxID=2782607 RepID=A0A9X1ISI6_9SPHN|nr:DMT family transporter [Sphingobium nicotianae]MBT2188518.1 hypothetical protein [Sphingobium nicotianae]
MAGTMAAGLGLALFSAITSSLAHALLKSGDDKLVVQAWIRMTEFVLAAPIALWIGLPPANLWPWLIAAMAIHAIYQLALAWSYAMSDFTAAYPIARGFTPIFTALLGIAFLGDRIDEFVLLGIGIVSAGILCLAGNRAISRAGLVAAACTGLLTTCYTLVDAKGVRAAPDMLTFITWFFLLDSISMPLALFARSGRKSFGFLARDMKPGMLAGIMAPISFAPALFALGMAPVGVVAAVRESSIVFGLALGAMVLKERLSRLRIGGALLVTLGTLTVIARSAFA